MVGDTLGKMATEYVLAEAVIERMSQVIDSHIMHALLRQPDVDLSSEQTANDSAAKLATRVKDVQIVAEFDQIHERFRLKIMRMSHGNILTSYLDNDFLESADYAQIQKQHSCFKAYLVKALTSKEVSASKQYMNLSRHWSGCWKKWKKASMCNATKV